MNVIEPFGWQDPLWQWAQRNLERHRFVVSGFPTGAGKTIIALAAARAMKRWVIVVAPKVTLTQWHRTAEAMGCHHLLAGVINPERLAHPRGCEFYTRAGKWRIPPNAHVIWDEPHRNASGIKGVTTHALAELKAYGCCLHAMSATLACSPLQLRALGWWAGLHGFTKPSFYSWCRNHGCADTDVGFGQGAAGRQEFRFTSDRVLSRQIMEKIRADFGPRFRTMKAEDIPGFPTETIAVQYLDIDAKGRAAVDAAYAEMSERLRAKAGSAMAEVTRERERIEFAMAESLAELAASKVSEGVSPVVFLNFTEPRLRFTAKFQELAGFVPAQVYGSQNDDEREAFVKAFQANENWCAVVNQQAGGAGLNLHDELQQRPRCSLYVPGYKPDDIKQCFGRIRRCNGTHASQYLVIAAGTIQEKVASKLQRKLANMSAFYDAVVDEDLDPYQEANDEEGLH